jgi:hypothetical protein
VAKATTHKECNVRCAPGFSKRDGERIDDCPAFLNILRFLYFLNFFCFPAAPNSSTIATAIESRTASALCA